MARFRTSHLAPLAALALATSLPAASAIPAAAATTTYTITDLGSLGAGSTNGSPPQRASCGRRGIARRLPGFLPGRCGCNPKLELQHAQSRRAGCRRSRAGQAGSARVVNRMAVRSVPAPEE